jgi:hypothetical protein
MDIISAYQQVGSYRGAAELCGTTHKTVKKVIDTKPARTHHRGLLLTAKTQRRTPMKCCGLSSKLNWQLEMPPMSSTD